MLFFKKYSIFFIIIIACLLRFYKIDQLPSLNPDEAALGYSAYSLLETSKDEYGASWPLHFKSFGDYKPGGYVYLAMPFIKLLGLTPLAVRLPNLILSLLTIYIVYRLVLLLSLNFRLSILSALILCLSPWHIHFSRGAWEASAALFFIILGIYWFYLYTIHQKGPYLYLFPVPLALSLYFYHAARLVAPLLFLTIFTSHIAQHPTTIKKYIISLVIGIAVCIPVLQSFLNNNGASRFNSVGLFADSGPIARVEELINQHPQNNLFTHLIHNRFTAYTIAWTQNYTSHFDPNFLFLTGDVVPRSKSPNMGQLYKIEIPFLILGLIYLFQRKNSNLKFFTLSFLFISPIASSLTFQAPSALRALPMAIPLSIIIASGINFLLDKIKKPSFILLTSFLLITCYSYSILSFLNSYLTLSPQAYPFAWNTGFNQVIPLINANKVIYQNIYLTNKYDQPYVLYLFYSQYPPSKIQPQIKLTPPDQFGFSTVTQIDNIHFEKINWQNIPRSSLIIAADETVPTTPVDIINFPNGSPGFKIYVK